MFINRLHPLTRVYASIVGAISISSLLWCLYIVMMYMTPGEQVGYFTAVSVFSFLAYTYLSYVARKDDDYHKYWGRLK